MTTEDGYGLTEAGYKSKPFATLVNDLGTSLSDSLGAINLTPPSVFSVMINAFAIELSKIDLKAEEIYNAFSPSTATGYSLDSIAAYNGLSRLAPTYSNVLCQVIASPYTLIQAGSEAAVEKTNDIILFTQDLTISNESCNQVVVTVIDFIGTDVSLIISNILYTYTIQVADTEADIAEGLLLAIENASPVPDVTVVRTGATLTITNNDYLQTFSCFVSDPDILEIESCRVNVTLQAKEIGKIEIPAKSVNIIRTPVDGWLSINNLNSGVTGRELETDLAFRARRAISLKTSGSGTMEALKSRVLNITGVSAVSIFENATNVIDGDSRPPHSLELLALGGSDQDIANMIWLAKPAGIETYGNISMNVIDSSGGTHIVKFSRSTKLYIFVDVTLTTLNTVYNTDSTAVIKQNIVNHINAIGLGNDVIYQAIFADIYSVDGITNAVVQVGGSLDELVPPVKTADNISIPATQVAVTDINKISITVT